MFGRNIWIEKERSTTEVNPDRVSANSSQLTASSSLYKVFKVFDAREFG